MAKKLILLFMFVMSSAMVCMAEENVVYSGPAKVCGWEGVDLPAGVFQTPVPVMLSASMPRAF